MGELSALWILLTVVLMATAGMGQPPQAWLSAADFGASGSKFETTAATTAGSNQITVTEVGDLAVGQTITLSKGNLQYLGGVLWGPRPKHAANQPVNGQVEWRGFDGSGGNWVPYVLDIAAAEEPSFRWSDDLGRTWHGPLPLSGEWTPLSSGVEVRFGEHDWKQGWVVTFTGRTVLTSVIEKIEGRTITLRETANQTAPDALLRHCDDAAIQAAVDQALLEKRHLFLPAGWYRLSKPVVIKGATGLTVEGVNGTDTVLDISEGDGPCLRLVDGTEVTVRNLRLLGHSGFADRDQMGHLATRGATGVWGFYFKTCNAINTTNTERVLVENCHASRMSAECFYSSGRARTGTQPEPAQYTKQITYLRCSVVDSARNAFNTNNMAEGASVLNCRVVDVGGCTWEGASRFVKIQGNYVRNGGTVAMGNIRSRAGQFDELASGQHIVSDNVFESGAPYGGAAIRAAGGAQQVIIADNVFVNYASSAIDLSGITGPSDLTAGIASIRGNLIDLTDLTGQGPARIGIDVSASAVQVTDNQVFVRGAADPKVTGIRLREPAVDLTVADNQLRNCGVGLAVERAYSRVAAIADPQTFSSYGQVPLLRRRWHDYRGWQLVWLDPAGQPAGQSVIEAFDPETAQFKLREPYQLSAGLPFEVYPNGPTNWDIRANTLSDCLNPLVLEGYGSEVALVRDNIVTRTATAGVPQAVLLAGRFQLTGNRFSGFDEPGAAVITIRPDRAGRTYQPVIQGNLFQRSNKVDLPVSEGWTADAAGNLQERE